MAGDPSARRVILGERLRAARYAANLTQQDLAEGTFSKSYISAVERSKMTPSLAALRLLAGRLGVSLAYLLGEEDLAVPTEREGAAGSTQERPPDEDQFARRLDEARQFLLRDNPEAALERLGSLEAARDLSSAQRARWHWLHGWALLQQHQTERAVAALEAGLQTALESEDHRAASHLYLILANARAARREDSAAERAFQDAIHTARQIGDDEVLGQAEEQYGEFLGERGRYQEAYEHLRLAQAASARAGGDR
jgi:transcriptional regulator with XRE-family HTH domain